MVRKFIFYLPLKAPAVKSLVLLRGFPGSSSRSFFPTPNPINDMAKMGATPKIKI